jgi:hypothetical protein
MAVDLVSSDAEEQVLDPKLRAMLKFNDAVDLIKSAEQNLSAQYQPPQPANMFERKQMAAAEGIAGLAQRLAPGLQNRGRQMAASRNRQAMSGGIPGLSTPNMQGMMRRAQGGIVGYAEGGDIEGNNFSRHEFMYGPILKKLGIGPKYDFGGGLNEDFMNRAKRRAAEEKYGPDAAIPVGSGQPIPMLMQKYGSEQVMKYLNEQKRLRDIEGNVAPKFREDFEMMKANIESLFDPQMIRDIRRAQTGPDEVEMSYGGAVKKYAGPDGSEVELDPEMEAQVAGILAGRPERTSPPTYMSSAERRAERVRLDELSKQEAIRRREQFNTKLELARRGLNTEEIKTVMGGEEPQVQVPETVETVEAVETAQTPQVNRVSEELLRNSGIMAEMLEAQPTAERPPAQAQEAPTASQPSTRERMVSATESLLDLIQQPPEATPEIDSRLEALRDPMIDAATTRMAPGYEESIRSEIQKEAEAAYAVPDELEELIRERINALDEPLYTPEEERSRKISALLGGLASSNLIAQGGPRASAAVNQVTDMVKKDKLERAEKQFTMASDLINKDYTASTQAFKAGLDAMGDARNQVTVAIQMIGSMLNNADQRAAAQALEARQNRLTQISSTIQALGAIGTLEQADLNLMVQVQSNIATVLKSVQDQISNAQERLIFAQNESAKEAINLELQGLRLQEKDAMNGLNAVNAIFNIQPSPTTGTGSGAAGGSSDLPAGFVED